MSAKNSKVDPALSALRSQLVLDNKKSVAEHVVNTLPAQCIH